MSVTLAEVGRSAGNQEGLEVVPPPSEDVPSRMFDFGQFDFGQFDFGQLAEVEIGRSRNWPKSKLAEVEQIVVLLFSFFFSFSFSFFFVYICLFFLFPPNPKTPNPKPQTLKT